MRHEGVGFELGNILRQQLQALTKDTIPTPRTIQCDVINRRLEPEMESLMERWRNGSAQVDNLVLRDEFDWLAAEALTTSLVPAGIVQEFVRLIANQK